MGCTGHDEASAAAAVLEPDSLLVASELAKTITAMEPMIDAAPGTLDKR